MASRAKVILTAVLASLAILFLFLRYLQLLATAGAVVPACLMAGVPVVSAFIQGRQEQVG